MDITFWKKNLEEAKKEKDEAMDALQQFNNGFPSKGTAILATNLGVMGASLSATAIGVNNFLTSSVFPAEPVSMAFGYAVAAGGAYIAIKAADVVRKKVKNVVAEYYDTKHRKLEDNRVDAKLKSLQCERVISLLNNNLISEYLTQEEVAKYAKDKENYCVFSLDRINDVSLKELGAVVFTKLDDGKCQCSVKTDNAPYKSICLNSDYVGLSDDAIVVGRKNASMVLAVEKTANLSNLEANASCEIPMTKDNIEDLVYEAMKEANESRLINKFEKHIAEVNQDIYSVTIPAKYADKFINDSDKSCYYVERINEPRILLDGSFVNVTKQENGDLQVVVDNPYSGGKEVKEINDWLENNKFKDISSNDVVKIPLKYVSYNMVDEKSDISSNLYDERTDGVSDISKRKNICMRFFDDTLEVNLPVVSKCYDDGKSYLICMKSDFPLKAKSLVEDYEFPIRNKDEIYAFSEGYIPSECKLPALEAVIPRENLKFMRNNENDGYLIFQKLKKDNGAILHFESLEVDGDNYKIKYTPFQKVNVEAVESSKPVLSDAPDNPPPSYEEYLENENKVMLIMVDTTFAVNSNKDLEKLVELNRNNVRSDELLTVNKMKSLQKNINVKRKDEAEITM